VRHLWCEMKVPAHLYLPNPPSFAGMVIWLSRRYIMSTQRSLPHAWSMTRRGGRRPKQPSVSSNPLSTFNPYPVILTHIQEASVQHYIFFNITSIGLVRMTSNKNKTFLPSLVRHESSRPTYIRQPRPPIFCWWSDYHVSTLCEPEVRLSVRGLWRGGVAEGPSNPLCNPTPRPLLYLTPWV
jgi:hypothetical protein